MDRGISTYKVFIVCFSRKWRSIALSALALAFLFTGVVIAVPRHQAVHADPSGAWPTYMANNQRSGFNPTETILNPGNVSALQLDWSKSIPGGSYLYSAVAVANGIAYIGSGQGGHLDALDGSKLKGPLDGYRRG